MRRMTRKASRCGYDRFAAADFGYVALQWEPLELVRDVRLGPAWPQMGGSALCTLLGS